MADRDRILVFIPAYRCAPQIVRVLEQFREPSVHERFDEILVLDNCSPDNTVQAAVDQARRQAIGKITVARNRDNYGLGGSHKAAFNHAIRHGFTHIVVLHGDDQGAIRDALPVFDSGQHRAYDCCLGARFHPQARIQGYSSVRVIGNRVFNGLFSAVAGRRLFDLGSGLNIYQVQGLASGYWKRFHDNLMFNYCMILAHVQRRDRVQFFPISWREDDQVSNVKLFSQARRTLSILARFVRDRQAFMTHEFRDARQEAYEFNSVAERL